MKKLLVIFSLFTSLSCFAQSPVLYSVMAGTTTPAQLYPIPPGTNGKVLTSNGANAFPSFQVSSLPVIVNTTCDGIYDAATDIQAALNANSSIVLPPGNCFVSSPILLNSNNSLAGVGPYSTAIVTGPLWNTANIVIQSNGKNGPIVRDLAVLGNSSARPVSLVQFTQTTNCAITNTRLATSRHEALGFVQNTTDCYASGNNISDVTGTGWGISLFWGALRNRIIDNEIYNTGTYGIAIDDGTSAQIGSIPSNSNDIGNNIIYATGAMWCIGVEGSSYNNIHDNYCNSAGSVGISIAEGNSNTIYFPIGNIVHDNIVTANISVASIGIDQEGGSNNIIHHNRIAAGDICIKYGTGQTTPMLSNVANNNECDGPSFASALSQSGIAVTTNYINGLVLSDNEIYSPGFNCILLQGGNDISTINNKCLTPGKEGIVDTTQGASHVIAGNKIVNASASSAGSFAAIRLQPAASVLDRVLVAHNTFDDLQGSPTDTIGVWYVGGGGTFSRNQVYDNIALKSTIIPLQMNGVAAGVFGSIVPQTLINSSGTVTPVSVADGDILDITLTASVSAFAVPNNIADGSKFTVRITQGGAGGYTVTFAGGYKTNFSSAGNTTGKINSVTFINQGGTLIEQSTTGYM